MTQKSEKLLWKRDAEESKDFEDEPKPLTILEHLDILVEYGLMFQSRYVGLAYQEHHYLHQLTELSEFILVVDGRIDQISLRPQ